MSLLIKHKVTKQIIHLTKGADSIMIPRLKLENNQRKKIEDDLNYFALAGLRTLVIGKRIVTDVYYKDWN
jgi:magnesium-transporting ATPase (P-type)